MNEAEGKTSPQEAPQGNAPACYEREGGFTEEAPPWFQEDASLERYRSSFWEPDDLYPIP